MSRLEKAIPLFTVVSGLGFVGSLVAYVVGDAGLQTTFLLVSVGALTTACGSHIGKKAPT